MDPRITEKILLNAKHPIAFRLKSGPAAEPVNPKEPAGGAQPVDALGLKVPYLRTLQNGLKQVAHGTPIGRTLMVVPRVVNAVRTSGQPLLSVLPWALGSREYTNFSYDVTETSLLGLCGMVAVIANTDFRSVAGYAEELQSNTELANHVRADHAGSDRKWASDAQFRPGRHMLYYL